MDHHSTKKEMEEMQRRVMGRKYQGEDSPEAQSGRGGRKNLARSVIFHKTARVDMSCLSKDEMNELRREERRYYNRKTRELIHDRRENPKQKKMWGVLGVDSIIPKDDGKLIEQKQSNGHHAYGLNP